MNIAHFVYCREIGELHKASAMKASEVREAALSAALQAREELQWALDKEKQRTNELQELVEQQVRVAVATANRYDRFTLLL